MNEKRMSVFEHFGELRSRIIKVAFVYVIGFFIAFAFSKDVFNLLRIPFDQTFVKVFQKPAVLQGITLMESFFVYVRLSFLTSFFITSPFVFYHVWKFISPGLKPNERNWLIPFVFLASVFFIGGALFGYFFVFPKSFEFLLRLTEGQLIQTNIRMSDYYDFSVILLLGFGLAFELPLILFVLVMTGLVKRKTLIDGWRGAVISILIIAAVLTPADVPSMVMMATPLLLLYLLTLIATGFLKVDEKNIDDSTFGQKNRMIP